MFRKNLARALTLATILSLVMTSIATADSVTNNLDATVDATLETMNLTAGGATGSTTMKLIVNDNAVPGELNGCNLGGAGQQVTLGVKSSNTAVATVSPSTIQFTNCDPTAGSTALVTVTPAAGVVGTQSATISLSNLASDGATLTTNKAATLANFNVDPAKFTVNVTAATKTTPTISWAAPSPISYGTALSATQLNATASVAGTFAYTPAAGTVLGVGTHTLTTDFTPTDTTNYNTANKTVSITVNKAEQATLTVTDMPTAAQAYNSSFTVGSAGGSGDGAVTFEATGACSNLGALITITAGSGVCSVTASKAADDNYNATTSAAATVDASKAEQATLTVTDMPTAAQAYNSSFTVGSAGGSGDGAVTFEATGACSNLGALITITAGSGVCSVTASKAADDNYNATTSAAATVDASKAEQATLTVTDMPTAAQAYNSSFTVGSAGGSGDGAVTFEATGACSNLGALITITAGSGVCSVTASKAADDNYNATTSAAATVDAKKATATVTLSDLDQTYNGSPKFVTVTTVPAGLTVMVTYDDEELPPTNAGSYAVWASVLDDNYEGSATGTLVIAKGDQTIDFGGLADKTFGDAAFSVSATSTSGLTVTFNAGPAANCSVSGTTVTIGNAGSCTVTAAQAGDGNWNPAPSVNQTFTIAKAAGSVSINNIPSSAVFGGNFTPAYTKAGDGTASTTSLTTGTCTVAGDGTVNYVAAGLCTLQASVTESTNHLAATGSEQSFTIAKAAGSVSITNLPSSPLLNSSFTPVFQKLGDGATSSTSLTPTQCSVNATTGAVTFIGVGTCTLRANVAEGTNHLAASTTYTLRASYVFTGFDRPVDNNGILNVVKAGQAVPLKFRLTDASGAGVTTLTSVSVTVASLSCTAGTTADELEEYAAGSSGLQNLGDGYYQFNWKTPTNYANSCKTLKLGLGDGGTPNTALFQFRK